MKPTISSISLIKLIALGVLLSTLAACDLKPWVKPYERDKLADPLMTGENNPLDDSYVNHMFKSREGARGAEGGEGGGCGCN